MARTEPTIVAVTAWRENPPPPPPFRPDPRHPALIWTLSLAWIVTATFVLAVATVFVEPYLVGGIQFPAMKRRPGAQPTVAGAPTPRPHDAHVDGPLRVIRRPCVWFLLVMTLFAMSIARGSAVAEPEPCTNLPLPAAYVQISKRVDISLGHAVASSAEALSCAVVAELQKSLQYIWDTVRTHVRAFPRLPNSGQTLPEIFWQSII